MKFFPVFLAVCCLAACFPACTHKDKSGNDINIGKIITIDSKILGEQRKIMVFVPHNDYGPGASGQRFPVVYLLDGDAHFSSVMGMMQQLSDVNGNTVLPGMILVGIINTDRLRDLTPTHAATGYNGDSASVRNSGGGEAFISFIGKELIPYIDSVYPTAPYRTLIGHSLGGLTVINTLIHHPQLFNAYLAIDPSMWWDKQKLLKQADTALAGHTFTGKTLYLGIANTMPQGMDTARVRTDTAKTTIHIRSILALTDALKRNPQNGLRWNYKYYDGDNHGSVPLISEYDGSRFIFNYFSSPLLGRIFDTSTTAAWAVAALRDHYKTISGQMGYTVPPPIDYVNEMGYNCLQNKMPEKAHALFQLNIDNYPANGNVYDSMGDYYAGMGDKQKAIDFYTKAYAIDKDPGTKTKLDKLKS
jgi:predicted alpha/beta superfamily hydrolase